MLKFPALMNTGFQLSYFSLTEEIRNYVRNGNWEELDKAFKNLTSPSGRLFKFLLGYHDFSSIEFIISIRDANSEWEEDGIWHDDGSRVFAFSLSLTENAEEIKGGRKLRKVLESKGIFLRCRNRKSELSLIRFYSALWPPPRAKLQTKFL
jgi:hypothetical protein